MTRNWAEEIMMEIVKSLYHFKTPHFITMRERKL